MEELPDAVLERVRRFLTPRETCDLSIICRYVASALKARVARLIFLFRELEEIRYREIEEKFIASYWN